MTLNHTVRHAVRRALAVGAVAMFGAGALVANAKPAPTPKPQAGSQAVPAPSQNNSASLAASQLQTIVVTGTMIPRPESETSAAITIISAKSLKNLGVTNVEQAIDNVTSIQGFVAWGKSGETIAAVPGPDSVTSSVPSASVLGLSPGVI